MAKPSDATNYIYRTGMSPNTRAAVTQKNKIYGYMYGATQPGFQQIGVVSEFGHDESRAVEPIRGVGFGDQIAELVPGVTEPMAITLNKTLLYAVNLFQTLGYKAGVEGLVRSLKHHRWPFDIKQELVFSEIVSGGGQLTGDLQAAVGVGTATVQSDPSDGTGQPIGVAQALFTFYEGCWFNSYSASYTSDAAIVAENGAITVTDVIDGLSQYGEWSDTGLAPVNGAPGQGFSLRFSGSAATPTPLV